MSFWPPPPQRQQPRFRKCSPCEGTGKLRVMGIETCSNCAGSGRDKNSDLWAEPCLYCNGSGSRTYCRRELVCRDCGGFGEIQY